MKQLLLSGFVHRSKLFSTRLTWVLWYHVYAADRANDASKEQCQTSHPRRALTGVETAWEYGHLMIFPGETEIWMYVCGCKYSVLNCGEIVWHQLQDAEKHGKTKDCEIKKSSSTYTTTTNPTSFKLVSVALKRWEEERRNEQPWNSVGCLATPNKEEDP